MPDSITPVGAMVQPPSPMQGLNTLSNVLGVQQQAQNLQTGTYRQQEAQSGAQQAQQAMSERQIMVQSIRSGKDPDGNSIMLDGGDPVTGRPAPDPMKLMALARRWMPQTGDAVIQNITKTQSDKAQLAEATRGLEQNYRNDLSGIVQSFKNNPNAKGQDVTNAVDQYIAKNPSAAAAGHWANNLVGDHFDGMSPAAKNDALMHIAQVFQPAATTSAQNLPAATTNAAGQIISRSPVTGALAPAGTAPAGTFTGAAGTALGLNPSTPVVAGQTTTASGTAMGDNERNAQISGSVSPSRASITLADQISKLSDEVHTGKYSKEVTDLAATLGQHNPELAARQLMSKYAAQLQTQAIANAPSDNSRSVIEAGFPDPQTMSPEAIKKASEYIKGSMLMNLSRAANARQFQSTHGNTQGLRIADDQFASQADPLMYTYQNLPKGQARTDFIKRHFATQQDAADFVRRKNAVEHYGGFNQ